MNWNEVEDRPEGGGTKLFIRLKDGESIEGIFAGQPHKVFSSFKDKQVYETYAEGRTPRYRVNFIVKEDGKLVPKIFETSFTTINTIKTAIDEYGKDVLYKVKRTGAGKDNTVYHILFKSKVEAIPDIKLLDLSAKKQEKPPIDNAPPPDDADMIPEVDDNVPNF